MDEAELRRGIGLRHPARRALPAPHRRSTTSAPCRGCSAGTGRRPRAGPASCSSASGLAREFAERYPAQLSGRPAAARRRGPGARRRPAGDAHGRAVLRRRPRRARAAAGRVPAPAGRARQDDRVRHPRHRRGHQARRPGRGAARRRAARPGGRARPTCSPTRPTTSSPTSSAATAATARLRLPGRAAPAAAPEPTVRPRRDARPGADAGVGCSSSTTTAGRSGWVEPRRIGDRAVDRDRPAPRRHRRAAITARCAAALDAALSSPSRRGVIVDDSGALCGTVARPRGAHRHRGDRPARARRAPADAGAPAVGDGPGILDRHSATC